ncbi:GspH/FimT family pseudopilin [Nevskia sp.]|uniref:GspH/FimT family pseudopilin n=1 Tax=Nevskia sp. TaxID=1929292 RepID=UPI0025F57F9B|nr:GspH/FimT family pseudopilin [Nevskia sp.]
MPKPVHAHGFTLLELMVAIAILAILLTFGLPSFTTTARQNCAVTTANTMLTVLSAARSEALKRDRLVAICKSIDGTVCADAAGVSWDRGYLMFVDSDGNGVRGGTETVLKTEAPLSTCGSITGGTSFANQVSFNGLGKPTGNGRFDVVANNQTDIRRRVIVSPSGRPRICNPDIAVSSSGTACGTAP